MTGAPSDLFAQDNAQNRAVLSQVFGEIKALKEYGYQYEVKAMFPDGSKDSYKGKVAISAAQKSFLSQSKTTTVLLTSEWFYRNESATKRVSVFSLTAYYARRKNAPKLETIFTGSIANNYLDSVLLKSGKIGQFSQAGDFVKAVLTFPASGYLRKAVIEYNRKTHLPVSVVITAFYPDRSAGATANTSGITKEITCDGYTSSVPANTFSTAPYFAYTGGKVVLKQSRDYKLSTIL